MTNSISVLDSAFNVKTDGTNTTTQFRSVLDHAVNNGLKVIVPPGTYTVAGLQIPSNIEIHFQVGAVMKLAPNSPMDTRCVSIFGSSNVVITGLLEIDGSMDTIASGNEHMHGLFISNARNVFIDNIYSHDCYGDNVNVTGSNDMIFSENINIKNIRAYRAGRKNLVIEHVDNLNIQVADLDNSTGGLNGEGSNSIDVEPYSMTGVGRKFTVNLGKVITRGCGNDFSAGVRKFEADAFTLNIDTLVCHVLDLPTEDFLNSGGYKSAIFTYAITLNINNFTAYLVNTSSASMKPKALWAQHGAQISINNMKVFGGCAGAEIMKLEIGSDKPSINIVNLTLDCPNSYGIRNERADLTIGTLKVNGLADKVLFGDTLSDNLIKIGMLDMIDSCSNSVINYDSGTPITSARIVLDHVRMVDNRPVKPHVFILKTGSAQVASIFHVLNMLW